MAILQSENHSGVNENTNPTSVEKRVKKSAKREESPYLKVRTKAVNIFRNQIDKSVMTKRNSIDRALEKIITGEYTQNRFLAEFNTNVEMLLDSKRFDKDCKAHNLNPFNAATHIVFDGSSKIELVLKNGLYPSYSTRLTELVEPLFTEEELKSASSVPRPTKPE